MSVNNNSNDIREVKSDLRSGFKNKRIGMTEEQKLNMDSEIQSRFLTLRQYASCSTVFTYVSKDIEVDTFAIIRAAWANGKRVAVPRCVKDSREMDFYYIECMEDLEEGSFGVREPI